MQKVLLVERSDSPVFLIAYTTDKFFIEALDKTASTNNLVRKLVNTLRDAGIRQIRQHSTETQRKKKAVVKQKPE